MEQRGSVSRTDGGLWSWLGGTVATGDSSSSLFWFSIGLLSLPSLFLLLFFCYGWRWLKVAVLRTADGGVAVAPLFLVYSTPFLPWFSLFESLFFLSYHSPSHLSVFLCFLFRSPLFQTSLSSLLALSLSSLFFVFLLGGIYRGKRERDRPYPCPIVAHGEWGLPALSRCGARWPIGVACMAWPPGFSSEAGRNKEEKTKNLSSPVARLGEEKGGTMSLKMTLFFFTWNGDVLDKTRCFI